MRVVQSSGLLLLILFASCSSGKSNLRQTADKKNPGQKDSEGRIEKLSTTANSDISEILGSSDNPKFIRQTDGSFGMSFMLTENVNSQSGVDFDPAPFVLSGISSRISTVCQADLRSPFTQKYKIGIWLEEKRSDGELRFEALLEDVDCRGQIDLKLTEILGDGSFALGIVIVNESNQIFMIGESDSFQGEAVSISFELEYAESFKEIDVDLIYPDPLSDNGKIRCNFGRDDLLNSCNIREVVDGEVLNDRLYGCKVGTDDRDSCLVGVYPDKTYEVRADCPVSIEPTTVVVAKKELKEVELDSCDFDLNRLTQLVIDGSPSLNASAGGSGHQFKASGITSEGNSVDLTNLVSWKVSDVAGNLTNIADISVDSPGFFRGLSPGVVNVTACLGCGNEDIESPLKSTTVMYEITPAVLKELLFECQSPSESFRGCKQVSVASCDQAQARPVFPSDEASTIGNVYAYKSDCSFEAVTENLAFQSSNSNVADFENPNQNLIGYAAPGSTFVTATYQTISTVTAKRIVVEPIEFVAVILPGMDFPASLSYCNAGLSNLPSPVNNVINFSAYELKTNCSVTDVTNQVVFAASPATHGSFSSGVPGELQVLFSGEVTVVATFNSATATNKYSVAFNQPVAPAVQSIFTMKNPVSTKGNLGGLSGADSACQAAAIGGGLGGDWMAFINVDNVTAQSRLNLSRNIANLNGGVVASEFGTSRPENQSLRTLTDEFKQAGSSQVWLGSIVGSNCNAWSVDQNTLSASLGCPSEKGALFSCESELTKKCDDSLPLLCISKSASPQINMVSAVTGDGAGEVKLEVEFNDAFANVGMGFDIIRVQGAAAPAACNSASGQVAFSVSGISAPIAKKLSFIDRTPMPGGIYSYLFCGSSSKGSLAGLQRTVLGVQSKEGNVEIKHTIFLTANETDAKIEFEGMVGPLAADAKCQAEAEAASLGAPGVTWKALLNYSNINIKGWLVNSNPPLFKGPIGNVKGELVALTFGQFLGEYDEFRVEYNGELRFWKYKANYNAAKNLIPEAANNYVFVGESGYAHCDDWTMGSGTTNVAGTIVGTTRLMGRELQSSSCGAGSEPEYNSRPMGRFFCISIRAE